MEDSYKARAIAYLTAVALANYGSKKGPKTAEKDGKDD